jgi:hypothetical protein
MAVTSSSLRVGQCYVTALDEVRKIVELDGSLVSYVVRGKLAFPAGIRNCGAWPPGKRLPERSRAKCRAIGDPLNLEHRALGKRPLESPAAQ